MDRATGRREAAGIEAVHVTTLNGEGVWKIAEPKNGQRAPIERQVRAALGDRRSMPMLSFR